MGTLAILRLWGPDAHDALAETDARLHRLESLWSRFRPDSDVSRLNRASGSWTEVAPETALLLERAAALQEETAGAFDVTLGTGLGRPVAVRGGKARLPAGAALDLGGIGKGAAVQDLLDGLRRRHVEAALVSLGRSSIGLLGTPPGRDHWRVGLGPTGPSRAGAALLLGEGHLSTSGAGRASRTIEPVRGEPAASDVRTATVLCADGARAEALSTALVVLGTTARLTSRVAGFEAVLTDHDGVRTCTPGIRTGLRRSTGDT
ncbi:FAD:protein FMN transferase [Propionicimonas sp.]|uniref:FAD:protein FMN transferase n=1 Tax=Propionicimonas sp. TaxID=1955623 RepID=UPI0039E3B236